MKRAALLALIGPLCLLGLSGCGFTPLYATNGTGADLAAIDIRPPTDITNYRGTIEDRTSFLLKQSLTDELKLHARETPRYALDTQITERRIPRGVRVNNVANRYEINMTVAYVLTDLVSGKPVLRGSAPVIVDYDSADPPYAGTVAAQDGDRRAAEQAAIAIRLALARYFAGRPESGPGLTQTPLPNNPDNDTP
jgi:LPS-assembly lipoprotein